MRQPKPAHRRMRQPAWIVVGVFLLAALFLGWTEKAFHLLQRPFAATGTWLYQRTSFLEQASEQIGNLKQAEERLQTLAVDRVQLEELTKENKALKEALGFIERQTYETVTASIVARASTVDAPFFVIDQGSENGIQLGDPVIVGNGMLLGKVMKVTPGSATIQTLTHPEIATAVGILGHTQTIGVAEGMANNLMRLKFIPQETDVKTNDLVVTSGLETRIPSGLLIGYINDVQAEPNAPFLQAVIEPMADVRQFRLVHVLIEPPL